MTQQQIQAIKILLDAIVDSVKATGPVGAPGGTLYAAMMTYGCTLRQFEQIMAVLVKTKKLTQRGDCYFVM